MVDTLKSSYANNYELWKNFISKLDEFCRRVGCTVSGRPTSDMAATLMFEIAHLTNSVAEILGMHIKLVDCCWSLCQLERYMTNMCHVVASGVGTGPFAKEFLALDLWLNLPFVMESRRFEPRTAIAAHPIIERMFAEQDVLEAALTFNWTQSEVICDLLRWYSEPSGPTRSGLVHPGYTSAAEAFLVSVVAQSSAHVHNQIIVDARRAVVNGGAPSHSRSGLFTTLRAQPVY